MSGPVDDRAPSASGQLLGEQAHGEQPRDPRGQIRLIRIYGRKQLRGCAVAADADRLHHGAVRSGQPVEPLEHQLGDVGPDAPVGVGPEDPRPRGAEQLLGLGE